MDYGTIKENHQIIIRTVSANWSRADRYPLSPRILVLQSILDRIEPPPVREPLPPPKQYAPPVWAAGVAGEIRTGTGDDIGRRGQGRHSDHRAVQGLPAS